MAIRFRSFCAGGEASDANPTVPYQSHSVSHLALLQFCVVREAASVLTSQVRSPDIDIEAKMAEMKLRNEERRLRYLVSLTAVEQ
jgi:hypothetical protein